MVTLHSTVHDRSISLLRNTFFGNLRVDPIWETPHLGVDLAKLHGSTGIVLDRLLEGRIELSIVQEYVGVMVPAVEVPLDRLDGLYHTIQLFVPCQYHKCCLCSRL